MFHLLWFIHILGIVLWLGGLATVGLLLFFMRREPDSVKLQVLPLIIRNITRITHIGAGLLLIGGIPMLFMIQNARLSQFWVQYMGGVGILVILISLFMLSASSKEITPSGSDIALALKSYLRWLYPILVLSLSVLVVVAFKF
jgi:putative copper export protein